MALSPQQRQLVLYGAPVVAVFALVSFLGRRRQPQAAQPSPPVGYTLPVAPSTDAIGTGQLAEWENLIGQAITQLGQGLSEQIAAIPQVPAPTQPAQPQPQPSSQNCTPKFPWHWENGILVDNYTGRPAFYGPQSQPAGAYSPGQPIPPGEAVWQMPDGRWAIYRPDNWSYSDPSRPPVCH